MNIQTINVVKLLFFKWTVLKWYIMKLIVLSLFLFMSLAHIFGHEIHVSPTGSDNNSGTKSAPVQSLEKARDLARSFRKTQPRQTIFIKLHSGTHFIRNSVVFSKEDSGTPETPLIIEGLSKTANSTRSDGNDSLSRQKTLSQNILPHLVGGVVVSGWKKSTFNNRDDVWEADLKPLGITTKFKQIYLDGHRQIWARYPNYNPDLPYSGGWAYVDGVRPPMYQDIEGEPLDKVVLRVKDARNWQNPNEGEVCIFPRYNWWNRIEKIKSYQPQTRTITLEQKMTYAARPEDRFAVFGLREELDAPGEWYQDVEKGKLYFIPPVTTDLTRACVTIPTLKYTLEVHNAQNIIIRGLEMSCSEEGAVRLVHSENCSVEKSLIHDMGYFDGAGLSLIQGKSCTFRGCDIWNIGGHGVNVSGGDNVQMTLCEHRVDNCYIHHVGQFNRHGIGVMLSGAGTTVSHNLLHDLPRCGIFYGGVLHKIEYNRIRHCNTEMEDTGCTYGGGWTGGWTTIRYNHCTDSIGFNNHGQFHVFAWGIYLDESGCGYDVYGNIVERCQMGAMHLHNARENHIYNNIFAHNAGIDGTSRQISFQGWNDSPQGIFLRDRQPRMLRDYNRLMTNPQWKKMRGMTVSPENPFLEDGTIMRGNRTERNIFYFPQQPNSTYASIKNVNLYENIFDNNLIWNGGQVPVKTDCQPTGGKTIASLNSLLPNINLTVADKMTMSNPNQTTVKDWYWYHKTFPDMKMERLYLPYTDNKINSTNINNIDKVASSNSKSPKQGPFMRLFGRYNPKQPYIKYTCIKSADFQLIPGKDYRLSFDWNTTEVSGRLIARVVSEKKGLWKTFGSSTFLNKEKKMKTDSIVFHVPASGEKDYDPRIEQFNIQFEFQSAQGTVELGHFQLDEVKPMSSWEAWQAAGADIHSVIADPLFIDAANGDYRLQPNSPALKLGFKQIPVNKIGPYSDSLRVTWPIHEAIGVRENPQWLTSVPMDSKN